MSHHATCHHGAYRLSCVDYEALLSRAAGKCELCGVTDRKLFIDHDHEVGWSAVRGMLCPNCNWLLGRIDKGYLSSTSEVDAYRSRAWHLTTTPLSRELPKVPKPKTAQHTCRIPNETWSTAQDRARREGRTALRADADRRHPLRPRGGRAAA